MRQTTVQAAARRLSLAKRQQPVKRFQPEVQVHLQPRRDFFVSSTPQTTRRSAHRLIVRDGAREVEF